MSDRLQIYVLGREWGRQEYVTLVDTSLKACSEFILARRIKPMKESQSILNILNRFLIQTYQSHAWPGTRLLGSETAEVSKFQLTNHSATILRDAADSLWSWIGPNYPEDLAFLRSSGHPWFVSITHEHDAFFKLSESEKEMLEADFGKGSLIFECPDQCPEEVF